MRTALRWTSWILVADVALIVAIFLGLWVAGALGIEIQSLKWPTVFYGGMLIMLLMMLSIVWLVLQAVVSLRSRKAQ